jgi:mono/diheme cytochrome c family protein
MHATMKRLLVATALVWSVTDAGAGTLEQEVKLGDTVTGTIADAAADTVGVRFFAAAGTKVGISVAPDKGTSLKPTVTLRDAAGDAVDLGKALKVRKKGVSVKNFTIGAPGSYVFDIAATEGSGGFTAKTAGKGVKKLTLPGAVPDGVVTFTLQPGSSIKGSVTAAAGTTLQPSITSIADRVGALTVTGATASGRTAKFKSATTTIGGRVTLTVGGTGTGDFTAKLVVKVARSKETFDADVTGRDPTTSVVARLTSGEPDATEWDDFPPLQATVRSDTGSGSTNHSYAGEFNMTGSKAGLAPFPVDVRAAHDGTNLYVRFRWHDATATNDLNRRRWYFNGDISPMIPDWTTQFGATITEHPNAVVEAVPSGWSSNLNDDKFAVAWAIGDPNGITTDGTNEAGLPAGTTFAQGGCAVACHGSLGMAPPTGLVDLWHWKTARSNPLGYVNDQWGGNGMSRSNDPNQAIETRNRVTDNTSGPLSVLNPAAPNVVVDKQAGMASITFASIVNGPVELDGRLFLTADAAMPIESTDAVGGQAIYAASCQGCHLATGKGVGKDFAKVGLTFTRAEIVAKGNDVTPHGGGNLGLDGAISVDDTNRLIARIRAFAGAPGYTLSENNGANFAADDIAVVRNFEQVYDDATGNYTVIVRRKLVTADTTQDVQFTDLSSSYLFGLAVMEFDGQNHAGAPLLSMTFEQP